MDNSDRTIVVTGATGRQGGAVATHLLSGGWRVKALTRNPEGPAARRLGALGADVIEVDLGDRGSLGTAFSRRLRGLQRIEPDDQRRGG